MLNIKSIDILNITVTNKFIIDNQETIRQLWKLSGWSDYRQLLDYRNWIDKLELFENNYQVNGDERVGEDKHLDSELPSLVEVIKKLH